MPAKDVQENFRSNLIFALDETFEGPASQGSVYLDSNAGFRQSLAELSVKEATASAWPAQRLPSRRNPAVAAGAASVADVTDCASGSVSHCGARIISG